MPKNVSNQNLFCECNLGRRREEVTTGDYKITAAVNLHWIFHELHVDGNLPFSAYVGRNAVEFVPINMCTNTKSIDNAYLWWTIIINSTDNG